MMAARFCACPLIVRVICSADVLPVISVSAPARPAAVFAGDNIISDASDIAAIMIAFGADHDAARERNFGSGYCERTGPTFGNGSKRYGRY
jgi:hypothetical protein